MVNRWVLVVLAVTFTVSGCTLNAGTAFADEYSAYLDSVPEVADHQVQGYNDLPGTGTADTAVTLVDGLTEQEVAEVVAELAAHEGDQSISENRLNIRFPASNGSGEQILVSVSVVVSGDSAPISLVDASNRVEKVVDFAESDPDLSGLTTTFKSVYGETTGDAFAAAERLHVFAGDQDDLFQVTVNDGVGSVSLFAGDSVEPLRSLAGVLAAVPEGVTPDRWRATSLNAEHSPRFEIALPAGTEESAVEMLQAAAKAAGLTVDVTVAIS